MAARSKALVSSSTRRFLWILYLVLFQQVVLAFGVASAEETAPDDLMRRLQQLEVRIKALQVPAATPEIETATDVYRLGQVYHTDRLRTTPRLEFKGRLRFGADYNSFSSQSVVSRVGTDPEESLRRLDELLAQVETMVERSGSSEARALLDEARFFRNQAEAELAAGDEEAALRDMSVSESLALEAARLAGEEITRETREKEWDGFAECRLHGIYRPSPRTRHEWINDVRKGDEYFQERLRWEIEHALSAASSLLFQTDSRIRDYQDDLLDDYVSNSTDLRWRWRPDKRWTVRLENLFDIKSEYETDPDEGYWSQSPRAVLEYVWGSFHQVQFEYNYRLQEYLSKADRRFNSERHSLRQRYHYYGSRWRASLAAEETWRDYNKPRDEDDYRQVEVQLDASFDLWPWLSLGAGGGFEERRHSVRGDTASDYDQWRAGPVLEMRWTESLSQAVRYQWTGRTHRDRDSSDALDKSLGDFDEHRLALETWWSLTERLDLSLNLEGEWRWYRNGQTGQYETYLPDYRPLSNSTRYTASGSLSYDLSERIRLYGSFYRSEERHQRYSGFDLDETTANLEAQILF